MPQDNSYYVTLQCDVRHNDDCIYKITASVLCFLVDNSASGNNLCTLINIRTKKISRCSVYQRK